MTDKIKTDDRSESAEYSEGRTIEALALSWQRGDLVATDEFVPVEQYRALAQSRNEYRKRAYHHSSDKIKIVIFVDGGCLREIYASLPDTEFDVSLIDGDVLEATGKSNAEIEEILGKATGHLYPIW